MRPNKIAEVLGWEALDSRGRPTVACRVTLTGGATGRAVVPSGASTGTHEAHERRDGGDRFGGQGCQQAVAAVNGPLADLVVGREAADRRNIDAAMEQLDGEPSLGNLGANAVLAVSLAVCLAHSQSSEAPLWRLLNNGEDPLIPLPMINILSGGAHAKRMLDIQDVLAVPLSPTSFAGALECVARVRASTAQLLEARGGSSALVADEGGLAGVLDTNEAALELVTAGIELAGFQPGIDVGLAVDIAANQIFTGDGYRLPLENAELSTDAWLSRLERWCISYPIVSIEDVLAEDEWAAWKSGTLRLGSDRQLLGDDLFVTNVARLQRGIRERVANAVLVKVNQAGTVSRAEDVMTTARAAGYATVVSARSGDTEDAWLADLSVGWSAGQIKVGSTMRSERTSKWNRLLEIEADPRVKTRYAGPGVLGSSLAG
jgi:enolase